LDKAGRYYIHFLLAVSALSAVVRLSAARLYTQMESERLSSPRVRRQRIWMGAGAIALSPAILLYSFWGPLRPWMWVTFGVGVLAGAEQFSAVRYYDFQRLLWHTRMFGVLSALTAAWIYLCFVR
jgi:hypothetical protein